MFKLFCLFILLINYSALGQKWEVTLTKQDKNYTLTNPSSALLLTDANPVEPDTTIQLTLHYSKKDDPKKIEAHTIFNNKDNKVDLKIDAKKNQVAFSLSTMVIPAGQNVGTPDKIVFKYDTINVTPEIIVFRKVQASSTTTQTSTATNNSTATKSDNSNSVLDLAMTDGGIHSLGEQNLYDDSKHIARFLVTPLGNVLERPAESINEGDIVHVIMFVNPKLKPSIIVRRKSGFRPVDEVNISGAQVNPPSGFIPQAGEVIQPVKLDVELGDFAPGQGQVEITAMTSKGEVSLGSFDFGVNSLYTGAFSLGPIYSWLSDSQFGLTVKGTDTVITVSEQSSPRIYYVFGYTPFIWGPVDYQKTRPFLQHINPFIALILNDILNNALVGVSIDMLNNSVYINFGAHIGKVRELDPNSNLKIGSPFSSQGTIPTVTRWKSDWFFGMTIDFRAAAQFFGKAFSFTSK
jgi:hypothetical protein